MRPSITMDIALVAAAIGMDRARFTNSSFEMDADLSHQPKCLEAFFRELRDGADVLVCSRNIPGGAVEGWGMGRQVLSKGGSLYSRMILGVPVRDLTTGFKAFRRQVLEAIDLETVHSNGYSFQIETTYRALRRGFRVVDLRSCFESSTTPFRGACSSSSPSTAGGPTISFRPTNPAYSVQLRARDFPSFWCGSIRLVGCVLWAHWRTRLSNGRSASRRRLWRPELGIGYGEDKDSWIVEVK